MKIIAVIYDEGRAGDSYPHVRLYGINDNESFDQLKVDYMQEFWPDGGPYLPGYLSGINWEYELKGDFDWRINRTKPRFSEWLEQSGRGRALDFDEEFEP